MKQIGEIMKDNNVESIVKLLNLQENDYVPYFNQFNKTLKEIYE